MPTSRIDKFSEEGPNAGVQVQHNCQAQAPKPRGFGLTLKSHGPPPHPKNLRCTATGRTGSSPPCSVRTSSILLVAPLSKCPHPGYTKFSTGRTKCRSTMYIRTNLGLDLIDPRSSFFYKQQNKRESDLVNESRRENKSIRAEWFEWSQRHRGGERGQTWAHCDNDNVTSDCRDIIGQPIEHLPDD